MSVRSLTPVRLTAEGASMLSERLADIQDRRLIEMQPLLVGPERDERDVATFEALLIEAADLAGLLAEAEILDLPHDVDRVCLGARVGISMPDGTKEWVRPVHPSEATVDSERISAHSPLARALMGARKGDRVVVSAPTGEWECLVDTVEA